MQKRNKISGLISLSILVLLFSCSGEGKSIKEESNQNQLSKMKIANTNKESVRAFFKALEDENAEAVSQLFAENGQHINPYHSELFPSGAKGREEIYNYWAPVFPNFNGMTFRIKELYAMEDPTVVYASYKGYIGLKGNSGFYSN
ncbi:MAG: nuclear transport factor 2 family protein, partial [Bacteroidota bacterium]